MNAEQAVLGTIMKHNYLFDECGLIPENFENEENRSIFETMKMLKSQQKPIDLVSLTLGDVNKMGGAAKIATLPKLANEERFDSYVNMVMELYQKREKQRILHTAQLEEWTAEDVVSKLNALSHNKINDMHTIADLTTEVFEKPWQEHVETAGVITGLSRLQSATNGWQKGELTLIAARPSVGKTDVLLHLTKQAGWSGVIPIVFSLEMTATSLRDRMIASTGGFNRSKMRNLTLLTDQQKKIWSSTLGMVSNTNTVIFDRAGQTLSEIRTKVRKVAANNKGKDLIVLIDYLTLIKPEGNFKGNMHQAVGDISKGLKALAKEFDCPVIALAQLSRNVETRPNKRPMLSDLRESGSLEEDADTVIFLYRDSYYSKDDQDMTMEFIIAKNRNGATGTVKAGFNRFTGALYDDDSGTV